MNVGLPQVSKPQSQILGRRTSQDVVLCTRRLQAMVLENDIVRDDLKVRDHVEHETISRSVAARGS
jgi:hypothetical protein